MFEIGHRPYLRARQVDAVGVQGGEDAHFRTGPRHGNVQAPFASLPVERAEVHCHVPAAVRSVGHAEQDDVPLVALHGFEIHDEHGLEGVRGRKGRFDLRVRVALFVQKILDHGLLFGIEGNDADRLGVDGRIIMSQTADDLGHDGFRLSFVVPGAAPCVEPFRSHEADRAVVHVGGREGDEAVDVVPFVGERDQTFLARSVVQIQRLFGNAGAQHFIQDAFQIAFRIDLAVRVVLGPREEIGRRHLLRVAGG